ncbi:MAG TPA: hypothetical protein VFW45_02360 [Candidatus Polarisedimenticolia bacterium]|nr:hypothetical protein [Candidatus Polarisedimenticolia bacterium]
MKLSRMLLLLPLILGGTGCNDEGDTIIVNPDCGVIRTDLLGTYSVTFNPVVADFFNCSDPSFNGQTVTVTSQQINFNSVQVFASGLNVGFTFNSITSPQSIFGNVEADTCGTSFSVLDNEGVYLQCFGTFDRSTGLVQAACDSAAVLETPVTDPPVILSDCDVDPILQVTLAIN